MKKLDKNVNLTSKLTLLRNSKKFQNLVSNDNTDHIDDHDMNKNAKDMNNSMRDDDDDELQQENNDKSSNSFVDKKSENLPSSNDICNNNLKKLKLTRYFFVSPPTDAFDRLIFLPQEDRIRERVKLFTEQTKFHPNSVPISQKKYEEWFWMDIKYKSSVKPGKEVEDVLKEVQVPTAVAFPNESVISKELNEDPDWLIDQVNNNNKEIKKHTYSTSKASKNVEEKSTPGTDDISSKTKSRVIKMRKSEAAEMIEVSSFEDSLTDENKLGSDRDADLLTIQNVEHIADGNCNSNSKLRKRKLMKGLSKEENESSDGDFNVAGASKVKNGKKKCPSKNFDKVTNGSKPNHQLKLTEGYLRSSIKADTVDIVNNNKLQQCPMCLNKIPTEDYETHVPYCVDQSS